jgi:hypothetical protein
MVEEQVHIEYGRTVYVHQWTDAIHVHSITALVLWKHIRSQWISNLDKSVDESALPPPPQISDGFLHFPNTEVYTSFDMSFPVK